MLVSDQEFKHGDLTTVETKYGNEVEVKIWKLLGKHRDGGFCYSYVRTDGMCSKQRLLNKAERRKDWARSAVRKSNEYYEKSNKDRDFLVLAEPIKVGHHSERRHRKAIDDAWNNMGKSVAMANKATSHEQKAEGLERASKNIFIDVPESVEQLEAHIANIEDYISIAKEQKAERFVITNAQANKRRYKKRLEIANKLWTLDFKPKPKPVKKDKQAEVDNAIKECGVIFAFSNSQFDENAVDGVQYVSIGHGGYCPKENVEKFKQMMGV